MEKLWGSRFTKKSDPLADKFSYSIEYDCELALEDIYVSIAHAQMLGTQGIIPKKDSKALIKGLKVLINQIEKGTYTYDTQSEDIHTDIQSKLKKLIGDAADKLHTARSRNDLIVTDMRLYCMAVSHQIMDQIASLQLAIIDFAEKEQKTIIPAYTHLQSAQLVTLAHYCMAYVEMLTRDDHRFLTTAMRIDELALGSCALSGTSLPINRVEVAQTLEFGRVSNNSIDSVSDRDFVIDMLNNIAIMGIHCSRLAEDFIIWSSSEFNFLDIDDALCTGSSIMPHKKNPDILELIRGESATFIANANRVQILLKGTPLCYNRDFQLDKPPLMESVDKILDILPLLTKLFNTLKVKYENIEKHIHNESFFSVDIMEYLISKGVSYRDAHDAVGKLIKLCDSKNKKIADLDLKALQGIHKKFDLNVKMLLDPKNSVKIKQSYGSTNPTLVARQIKKKKKEILKNA